VKRAWLAAILATACAGSAQARSPFQERCEAMAAGSTAAFSSHDNGYRIDNTIPYRTLTQMKRPGVRQGFVLGLTRTESRVAIKVDGRMLEDPAAGLECVVPRIDVSLYYQPIVIYIGSEFEPDTCAYREILAHEMRHLNSYLAYLPKVEQAISARLAHRYDGKPLYARSGQARDLLQREIDRGWMPYIKAEMSRIEQQQAAIDSPREYARLSKVCQGEVQSLIGSTRRTPS